MIVFHITADHAGQFISGFDGVGHDAGNRAVAIEVVAGRVTPIFNAGCFAEFKFGNACGLGALTAAVTEVTAATPAKMPATAAMISDREMFIV